ncbi:NPCBM/NEW2 domain-containing protein [Virgibacillus siamensis]|uniref:NPCBM/NEW2 domain-containing protein n=1 Tax=Virgibacillus siamensis TaxID=480071 RepID=UPI000984588C|nr:NPCBM/NEW2 domain-containing protein [Virgibacillus siamensis]
MKSYLKNFPFVITILAASVLLLAMGVFSASVDAETDKNTTVIGNVTDITSDGSLYTITADDAKVRVNFYKSDMFRIRMAPDGNFKDPTDGKITVKKDYPSIQPSESDAGKYYKISTDDVVLRVYKDPLRFALYEADNKTIIWEEAKGLTWTDKKTVQTLKRGEQEQYFGGGMQNGRFTHRGDTIDISVSYDWNDGGNPNAAPFYMSTAGYGVLRNTFEPGQYSFKEPVKTTHNEKRFDAFYFYGPGLKQILDGYTELTGRPFMPPIYGLELGDADCYNEEGETTMDAVNIAEGYIEHDMPVGWMLVNDGYGCGYENLKQVGNELRNHGVELGLWTENGLPDQKWEVGEAGVRVRKLDVAWVGKGYEFALNACETAYNGIENNSNARGFVWMVEGWAGAQRCGTMWTGDQYGSWDNIRFTIPTIAGSGLSGQAFASSDIDGIFGGSAETYVRDLQWKAFIPMSIAMSGWASKDKQPWVYGEPYTSINRKYLKLHERLLPYTYTYAAEAHRDGTPPVRSLVLEYPNDPKTWGESVKYEFLSGESFLVAPVYKDTDVRNNIYLPEGLWIDYWNGDVYEGKQTVNNYPASLGKLPLFVKAGAIIPMWAPNTDDYHEAMQRPLTLDIYPKGDSSFTLYMDEGVTTEYKQGEFAEQTFDVSAPEKTNGTIKITVGAYEGEFDNMPEDRGYQFTVHSDKKPGNVFRSNKKLRQFNTKEAYQRASEGWYYDNDKQGGIVYVKTEPVPTSESLTITMHGASAVGGKDDIPAVSAELQAPDKLMPGEASELTVEFTNNTDYTLNGINYTLDLPEGWETEKKKDFKKVPKGGQAAAVFDVKVPEDTQPDDYAISVKADYKLRGEEWSISDTKMVETLLSNGVWVSDLDWTDVTNGWGQLQIDSSNGGKPLTLDGVTYDKGLGAHALSEITYDLNRLTNKSSRFVADIGVDDEIPDYGSVVFQVFGDGQKLYDSGVMTGTSDTKHVDVSIESVDTLKLVVKTAGDGKTGDHADWAGAKILFE